MGKVAAPPKKERARTRGIGVGRTLVDNEGNRYRVKEIIDDERFTVRRIIDAPTPLGVHAGEKSSHPVSSTVPDTAPSTPPDTQIVNPYKRAAQDVKTAKLIALFRRYRFTYSHLTNMENKHWCIAAECCGINVPSDEVRKRVIAHFDFANEGLTPQ